MRTSTDRNGIIPKVANLDTYQSSKKAPVRYESSVNAHKIEVSKQHQNASS